MSECRDPDCLECAPGAGYGVKTWMDEKGRVGIERRKATRGRRRTDRAILAVSPTEVKRLLPVEEEKP